MIAVLEYGNFSAMIQLPELKQIVRVFKPDRSITPNVILKEAPETVENRKVLEFVLIDKADNIIASDDVYIYKFWQEV